MKRFHKDVCKNLRYWWVEMPKAESTGTVERQKENRNSLKMKGIPVAKKSFKKMSDAERVAETDAESVSVRV